MKSYSILLTVFLSGLSMFSVAQDKKDPVLMTIDGENILLSEFEAVYKKNNKSLDQQSLEEYLDLYVKFRLKVHDAEKQGMDTLEKFKKELAGYRKQLAEPYLSDNEVTEELIREAYERIKMEVRASHIMVKVDQNASPEDTLKAHKKITAIMNRLKKGEDFAKLAKELSEDPSAQNNNGDLGYFTALFMVYPFETAAYTTEIGNTSEIVRTQFGYHILKVHEKRKNRGELSVAHIMTRIPEDATEADIETSKMKIEEIHQKLQDGAEWNEMAQQFSEDKTTANRGGKLPPFSSGRMVEEFEDASFALKEDGGISEPVRTDFGFHIIKRLKLEGIGTFEEMAQELKQKIARDGRSRLSRKSFIRDVKNEYGFSENLARRNEFYKVIDSTFFQNKWNVEKASKLKKTLFTLGDTTINQQDFANYLAKNQSRQQVADPEIYINLLYDAYIDQVCIEYENNRLKSKYPEFRLLIQEYHDGILLFDLTDKMVWSKAVKDTAGLEAFYEEHKNDHMWEKRLHAEIYSCADAPIANKVAKMVKSSEKKGYTREDILKMANESSQLNLEVDSGKFEKGDVAVLENIEWSEGIKTGIELNNRHYVVNVHKVLEPEPKALMEVRGLMTSAYQTYLEEQWIKELRGKYPVEIYEEHLSLIKE